MIGKIIIAALCIAFVMADDQPASTMKPTPSPWFRCPNPNAEDEYHPHPYDCTRFFQCSHNKAWEHVCDTPLHWSQSAKYCDWPANANCQSKPTTAPKYD